MYCVVCNCLNKCCVAQVGTDKCIRDTKQRPIVIKCMHNINSVQAQIAVRRRRAGTFSIVCLYYLPDNLGKRVFLTFCRDSAGKASFGEKGLLVDTVSKQKNHFKHLIISVHIISDNTALSAKYTRITKLGQSKQQVNKLQLNVDLPTTYCYFPRAFVLAT